MFGFFSNGIENLKKTVSKTAQALVGNVVDTVSEEEEFSEFVLDDMEDLSVQIWESVMQASWLTNFALKTKSNRQKLKNF